jgi:hypothetical protein
LIPNMPLTAISLSRSLAFFVGRGLSRDIHRQKNRALAPEVPLVTSPYARDQTP